MFIDEKTQNKINAELNQTVIRATLRPQDLVPAFLNVIKDVPEYEKMTSVVPSYALEDDDSEWWESEWWESEWWESEDCSHFLNETLFDALNDYAPDGYYFGAHEGDGSDFGYWEYFD